MSTNNKTKNLRRIIFESKHNNIAGILKSKGLYQETLELTSFLDGKYGKISLSQRLWHIRSNKLELVPCKVCGSSPASYNKCRAEYSNTCSRKCSDRLRSAIISSTTYHKSGKVIVRTETKNVLKKAAIIKTASVLGGESVRRLSAIEMGETIGCNYTVVEYGNVVKAIHSTCGSEFKIKRRTLISRLRYGVELCTACNPLVGGFLESIREKYEVIDGVGGEIILRHRLCGAKFRINRGTAMARNGKYGSEICIVCNPLHKKRSQQEIELAKFVASVYTGEIVVGSRKVVPPYELDIWLPELSAAIEFNGDYFHANPSRYPASAIVKCNGSMLTAAEVWEKDLKKLSMCKSAGIGLLVVWENNWKVNRDLEERAVMDFLSNRVW